MARNTAQFVVGAVGRVAGILGCAVARSNVLGQVSTDYTAILNRASASAYMRSYTYQIDSAFPLSAIQPLFSCRPLNLAHLSVSILKPEQHQPLMAPQEQLLVVLAGQVEVSFTAADSLSEQHILQPHALLYQPQQASSYLKTVGSKPALLMAVQWTGLDQQQKGLRSGCSSQLLERTVVNPSDERIQGASAEEYRTPVFETSTASVKRLSSFFLHFLPGATVPLHQHRDHDVLLIGLEGSIRGHDAQLTAPSIAYYRGGEPHGILGVGEAGATALAIEFYREPPLLEQLRVVARNTPIWQSIKKLSNR